jgi:NTP pyrophosphatase (non-canonical NTP hydrolase)
MRKELEKFVKQMEEKLKENDCKDGWEHETVRWLFQRLVGEVGELANLLASDTYDFLSREQQKECVDIANFAMMISDLTDKRDEKAKQ